MQDMNFGKVLVVAAHPDDEVLGCGGTMARFASLGRQVHVAILGEGLNARGKAVDEEFVNLRKQAEDAAKTMGVAGVSFFGLPDNKFDSLPLLDVIKIVETEIDRLKPEAVFTHHASDLNIDHSVTHRAVLTATRPVNPDVSCRALFTFEVPSATEWSFGQFGDFQPNVFVDVSETLEAKVQAMSCYSDEMRPFPHPRSAELIRALAQVRGSAAGVPAAEAFELVRWIA